MNHLPTYEEDLIIRYLSGEASPQETEHLSRWIDSSEENRRMFEEMKQLWGQFDAQAADQIDLDEEWMRMDQKISGREEHVHGKFRLNRYLKIAAVLIILILPSWFLIHYINAPVEKVLICSEGILEEQLPDGSRISMNAGSTLTYHAERGKERGVKLQGQAYFRVAHDQIRPFIVSGNDVRIEVLGTSFMVNTDAPGTTLEVVLDTGSIALYHAGGNHEKVILTPGQRAVVNGSVISVGSNTDRNYMSWKTKKLVFENDSLSAILSTLEKVYGLNVTLADAGLGNCRVSATFNQQSQEAVLNVLKETLSLSLEKNTHGYVLSGKGCR